MTTALIWPTIALVALTFAVWVVLFVRRSAHMRRHPPGPGTFADGETAMRYFRPVEMPANNLANLFEMPVLYFALVPLLLITGHAGRVQVGLAWIYVAFRAAHSFIHVGANRILWRFGAYLASCVILSAMWVGFAIEMAGAARF